MLEGQAGQDFLTGGGADRFVFRGKWDFDTVIDFSGNDRIDLRNDGLTFSELTFELTDADSDGSTDDLLIKFTQGDLGEIALLDTSRAEVTQSDFLF